MSEQRKVESGAPLVRGVREASGGSLTESSPLSTPRSLPTARPSQLAAMLPLAHAHWPPPQAQMAAGAEKARSISPPAGIDRGGRLVGPPPGERAAAIASAAAAAAKAAATALSVTANYELDAGAPPTAVQSWSPSSATSGAIPEPQQAAAAAGSSRCPGMSVRGRKLPQSGSRPTNLVISAAGAVAMPVADMGLMGPGAAPNGQQPAGHRAAYPMSASMGASVSTTASKGVPTLGPGGSNPAASQQSQAALAGGCHSHTSSAPNLPASPGNMQAPTHSWQRSRTPSPGPPGAAAPGAATAWHPHQQHHGPAAGASPPRLASPQPPVHHGGRHQRVLSPQPGSGGGGFPLAAAAPQPGGMGMLQQVPMSPQGQGTMQPRLSAPAMIAASPRAPNTAVAQPQEPRRPPAIAPEARLMQSPLPSPKHPGPGVAGHVAGPVSATVPGLSLSTVAAASSSTAPAAAGSTKPQAQAQAARPSATAAAVAAAAAVATNAAVARGE